jgi:ketosteroid isomerase-like protein
MMRFLGLCLVAVLTCSAALAKGHGHQNRAQSKTEKEVIAFLDALTEAGLKRDVATLDRLYSANYFHTNPDGSIMTKQQVLASYKAPPTAVIEADRHDEERVWIRGSVAFVNTRVTIRGRFNGNPYERQYRITYLFEKLKGGWRAVTSHATLILQTPK